MTLGLTRPLAALTGPVLALMTLVAPHPAEAQIDGWERSYLITYRECTQQSLLAFTGATERFPGMLDQRPASCRSTACTYQYTSTISPNALLQSLYGMVASQGYRARIGVEGLRYEVLCLPGRRAHPTDPEPRFKGFTEFDTPCGTMIDAAGDVLFDFDRAQIRDDAVPVLSAIAERIRELRPLTIEITGHTDSRGSFAYNQRLSERRAASVGSFLSRRFGITAPRYRLIGFGETQPRQPNAFPDGTDNPVGRQANRRVEIFLRTRTSGPRCAPVAMAPRGYRVTPRPVRPEPVPWQGPGRVIREPRPAPAQPLDPSQW